MARSGAASFRLRNLLVDVNATASTVEESVSTVSHSSSKFAIVLHTQYTVGNSCHEAVTLYRILMLTTRCE